MCNFDLCSSCASRQEEVSPRAYAAFVALAEQAVYRCIDYNRLGLGWHHPSGRTAYREATHPSFTDPKSRNRAESSRQRLVEIIGKVTSGMLSLESAVVKIFLCEIGVSLSSAIFDAATFGGVEAALEGELLLPLRALNEGQSCMRNTTSGDQVPTDLLAEKVQAIISAVVSGPAGFAEWRYESALGREQLRGLSPKQVSMWREPSSVTHSSRLQTHEDAEGELGFFWATKIGGPSHGFDYQGLCILPLLCNARHKVILISDLDWPEHPPGRAHWRLLWTYGPESKPPPERTPEPRLWLEGVHADFAARQKFKDLQLNKGAWRHAVMRHALLKSEKMRVPLSIDKDLREVMEANVAALGLTGTMCTTVEKMVLRPSNGIVEASDYLSKKHDWLQMHEESTEPKERALYIPGREIL
eukprot:gnl/TRDRNA2_/TRDRNA2_84161_c0_seq1.p1 gnl/TRDRNA2_/TRDRNA2_84161_c0~~gnl/TRDRNA2_/TRDRNA2_84161_c0_seq1.p1  ORF type:complete len:415 (+),score=72.07 gnl/TRDRNA2_/TRDRNA2_84161_c0_seq1:3-1247(+)